MGAATVIREVRADGTIDFGGAFTSVPRPRIVARLREASQQRVTLIVAPAGYGKSTVLREFLSSLGTPYRLYELVPENATLPGFVRGLVTALGDAAKKAQKTLVGALAESRDSPTRAEDLATWLHSHVKGYAGTIAIDDLHLSEDPEICAFLASLVDRSRGRVRWVIASRSTLDLPVATWLAYGDMGLAVDEVDLAFDLDEARRAARSARVAVRDDELQALVTLTSGWPTALAFALRSSTRSTDLRRTTMTTREMIFRYLAEQVYGDLADETRDFLLTVSLLPRLEIAVLTRAGFDLAEALLEWLRNRVSFISLESPGVYRIHELFREFLEYELRLLGHGAVVDRTQRLAAALESCERYSEALAMFLRAESWADVERLITANGFHLHDQGHVDILERAVTALPQDVRSQNAVVLALRAAFEEERRRFEDAERLYARSLAHVPDGDLRVTISLKHELLRNNRRQPAALQPSAPLESLGECQGTSAELRCEAASTMACAYAIEGRVAEAEASLQKAFDCRIDVDSEEIQTRVEQHAGFVAFYAGDTTRAKVHALQAATRSSSLGLFAMAARAFSTLSAIFETENDVAQALWYTQQMANAALKSAKRNMHLAALLGILRMEAGRGNAERVAEMERDILATYGSDSFRALPAVLGALALRDAWQGRFADAVARVKGSLDSVPTDSEGRVTWASLALYLAANDQRREAIDVLDKIETFTDEVGTSPYDVMNANLAASYVVIANSLLRRNTLAMRGLRSLRGVADSCVDATRAMCEGGSGTIDHPRLAAAIEDMDRRGIGGQSRLFAALASLAAQAGDATLTAAEVSVLQALAAGRSPKAIAAASGRSVNTVSNHVRSVISKLGCHGRNEAIAIAQSRGYLDGKNPPSQI